MNRYDLLGKGMFPETLPPCFISSDLKRALGGIIRELDRNYLNRGRSTVYARYNGTKHDGNRRPYGTPNPISYFNTCTFIAKNWSTFSKKYAESSFSVSAPQIASTTDDRAIIVPSLSELSSKVSAKIHYAPYILKTDIAQFFPSIYSHSIPWAAHGKEQSKVDQQKDSNSNTFNALDFLVQNVQSMQTRGVLIGPDAYRIIAEFIASDFDKKLEDRVGDKIVGAVRHVDDFYIGVRSEVDATVVLSELRNILQDYELQINDTKTRVINGLHPIDDLWAQELRNLVRKSSVRSSSYRELIVNDHSKEEEKDIQYLIDQAYEMSVSFGSESPIKLILRSFDNAKLYDSNSWMALEPKLQRLLFHFPHSMDYILLLVVKRYALGESIDTDGWQKLSSQILANNISYGYHHEIVWILWFLFSCNLEIEEDLVIKLSKVQNSHVTSLLVQAYMEGRCRTKPKIKFDITLNTVDENWLLNLVARSSGFKKSKFKGPLRNEFEHLAKKKIKLIDFSSHITKVADENIVAISKSRYGYDDDDDDDYDYEDLDF